MEAEKIHEWFQIGVGLAFIVSGAVYGFRQMKKMLDKKKSRKSEESFNKVNMKIWELLTEFRMRFGISRASVIQFHNGGKFMDGSSMRRMSISHQSCDQKVPSTTQFRQDVLISRFIEIIEILHENDPKIRKVESEHDSNSKKFYEINDTVWFSLLPIQCSDSLTIQGYISVEWCDLGSLDKVVETEFIDAFEEIRDQVSYLIRTTKDHQ